MSFLSKVQASLSTFSPEFGQVKPPVSHEEMCKFGPSVHERLRKEHLAHSQAAAKLRREAQRSQNGEQVMLNQELQFKHNDAASMHAMYSLSRTGNEDTRPQALQRAKKLYDELSK